MRHAFLLAIAAAITLMRVSAQSPAATGALAQRIAHTDPAAYRALSAVHGGAGSMSFAALLNRGAVTPEFNFLHRGVIPAGSGIGHHFHNVVEEMFVILDGELRFTVQDHEHFFDDVVEVVTDAGARRNHAAMEKIELRGQRAAIQQRPERHAVGAAVHRGGRAKGRRIRVRDPLRQPAGGGRSLGAAAHQRDGHGDDEQKCVSHGSTSVHPGWKTEPVDPGLDRPDR